MTGQTQSPAQLIDLRERVAIVTGAGSTGTGIGNGRAAALQLARAGAKVLVVDANESNASETVRMIEDEGNDADSIVADVSRDEDCAAIVTRATELWGRLDVLVNNVGITGPLGSAVTVDLGEWQRCVDINLTSMMLMARHSIPAMTSTGGGSIINISSAAGLTGGYPHIAYSTTKGALTNLTKSMAATHGPEGIRVNCVVPGFVYSTMAQNAGLTDEGRIQRREAAPLHTEGTGWDTANAALFFASDLARWITGTILPVDAGLLATHPALGSDSPLSRRK